MKFKWLGQLYRFTAFPNGSSSALQLFTKLLRPVMAPLHHLGRYLSTIFIDDTLLLGDSEAECIRNAKASLELFEKLGFVVHPEKLVLKPTQSITHVGFVLHSKTMTGTLTPERKKKISKTAFWFC